MILEYKLHRNAEGNLIKPPWVEHGGHFYDEAQKTYIGFSPSEGNRDYFIPDSVLELTVEELKARAVALGMTEDPDGINEPSVLSQAEVEIYVDGIVASQDLA